MEQLQLDDFLMYNFLSQVQISPDGKKVAYVATTPDLAKNGYNANLYRIDAESGENACLTNSGRVKGFCWQGAETLLYTVPVEADDAFPDGQTVLYRQNAGSAAEEVCRGEGSLSLEGVLLTMYDGRTNLNIQVAQELKRFFGGKVYSTIIPRNVRLSEAPSHGKPIFAYDRSSRGAEAYGAFADEFLKKSEKA